MTRPVVPDNLPRSRSGRLPQWVIDDAMGRMLDIVVDGGIRLGNPSTVISLIDDRIEVLREGSGDISWID